MTPAGFPHSDTPGSTLGCQLPRAYRRLLRPSSALDAKASTMCPSQLVTHTTNPTHHTSTTTAAHKTTRTTHTRTQTRDSTAKPQHTTDNHDDEPDIGSAHNTLQRCSRPLSRSQTTTPHHTHTPTHGRHGTAGHMEPKPQTPRPAQPATGPRLILQNPNSVPPPPNPPHQDQAHQANPRSTDADHRGGTSDVLDDSTSEPPPRRRPARTTVADAGVCAP